MKDGKQNKEGVIITTDEHFDYYTGPTDATRTKLMNPSRPNCRVKTLKTDTPVTVANNQITVTVYPDGTVDVRPSK